MSLPSSALHLQTGPQRTRTPTLPGSTTHSYTNINTTQHGHRLAGRHTDLGGAPLPPTDSAALADAACRPAQAEGVHRVTVTSVPSAPGAGRIPAATGQGPLSPPGPKAFASCPLQVEAPDPFPRLAALRGTPCRLSQSSLESAKWRKDERQRRRPARGSAAVLSPLRRVGQTLAALQTDRRPTFARRPAGPLPARRGRRW